MLGFWLLERRTGAFFAFAVRCSDVRETGRLARVGRVARGFEVELPSGGLEERRCCAAAAAAPARVGASQYGQTVQRGSIGFPHDSHGSLIRARQLGQRR